MSARGDLLKLGIDSIKGEATILDQPLIASGGVFHGVGKGQVFFVDAANGSDNASGRTPQTALATIEAAYNKCVADRHDTVVILSSGSSITISDQLSWAKDLTHLVGIAAPTPNSRARITSTSVNPIALTADGCIFANFRVFQNSSNIASQAITIDGSRNYFFNVDLQGQAHATAAASSIAGSLHINGGEENRFERCTFGLDTVVKTAGSVLSFDGGAARNEFIKCVFKSACETVGVAHVNFDDVSACDRYTLFEQCRFINFWTNHTDKLTEVFDIPSGMATCDFILDQCSAIGFDEWAQSDRGNIWVIGGTPAAGTAGSGSTGIAVEPS